MSASAALQRKQAYFARLTGYLEKYNKCILIGVDNVGAAQLQRTRKEFRGRAELLMGKNTMIRKCMKQFMENGGNPLLQNLYDNVKGNVGLVFTNGDMAELRNELISFRIPAPAKAGVVAPVDVIIPAGPTGLEPTATSFLQALNIPSKIIRGQVELTKEVHLIHVGDKVKPGAAALLQKLKITPFSYGIRIDVVYDNGFVFAARLLDLTDADVIVRLNNGLNRIAALGMKIGYPTAAMVPHSIVKAFQNLLAIGLETEYSFEAVDELKERLKNPGAFAAPAAAAPAEVKEEEAPAPVEDDESSSEMEGLDLFG